MAIVFSVAGRRRLPCLYRSLLLFHTADPHPPPPPPAPASYISDICRVLSDYRCAHHDIESALAPFSSRISTDAVEQVLKRCRNLSVSAHRFFLWARKLPGFAYTGESHQILVDVLGSSKQFPLIWDLLIEMRDGSVEITPEIFWVVFRSYAKANLPADAIRAFRRMHEFGLEPGVEDLEKLLLFLCSNDQPGPAQDFFDEVKSEFPIGSKTYSIVMKGWGDNGDPAKALKVYDEMLERRCPLDVAAYNTLLAALCQGKLVDEAYRLFGEMGSRGLEANAYTYSIFIRAACGSDDVRMAMKILDRMKRYELVPNVFTYNSIIKLLCKNDGIDDAHKLLDEMIEIGVAPDVWGYNAILATHCNRCEVNRALGVLRRMRRQSCQPDRHTYNMILKMLIGVGRMDRAMELWEGMTEVGFYPTVSTYSVMIHGLCKKRGRMEDACRYFEMMVDEGIPPYSCTCSMLRERLSRLGLRDRAFILSDKMRKSTSCSIQEQADLMDPSSKSVRPARPPYMEDREVESDLC